MHYRIYKEYEKICNSLNFNGSVLEVGAVPYDSSLLCMESLKNAREKKGINLKGPLKYRDFEILKGNANSMSMFDSERFDLVLCNALLEHDKYFWKTMQEIKRVTKKGGTIIIGTPGFNYYSAEKIKTKLRKLPIFKSLSKSQYFDFLFFSTLTFEIHNAPGDYYRFSPQAFKEVLFADLENVEIFSVMIPPRIIGIGRKAMN